MGAVKRALGCAAARPQSGVQSCPFQSIRWAGGSSVIPSHHTSPSSVRATLVKMQFLVRVSMALGFDFMDVPGATPKNPASGLMARSVPSGAGLEPGDVVTDRVDLPPLETLWRHQHGKVGLAAGTRKGAGHIGFLTLGVFHAHDQHVLGQPVLVLGENRSDPERKTLFPQQRIPAVSAAVGVDGSLFAKVGDVDVDPDHMARARPFAPA